MISNLYIENCCFTKHPFLTGCLGFQVIHSFASIPTPQRINPYTQSNHLHGKCRGKISKKVATALHMLFRTGPLCCRSSQNPTKRENKKRLFQVIQSDLFGMVKWPFQRLSDLQLGDKKVTKNHLVFVISKQNVCLFLSFSPKKTKHTPGFLATSSSANICPNFLP